MIAGGTKTANAVGGKTARDCDSCVRKRARWYCAADDAFLCHTCDASVHSANQLAGRHERVLLETTASSNHKFFAGGSPEPTWHQGLTRKARTPRRQRTNKCSPLKLEGAANSSVRLVPEMGVVEASLFDDDDDEQLLYRVPVFDPFETELCNLDDVDHHHDLELMEFAADVESLLGKGFDDTSCRNIDDLGLTSNYYKEEYDNNTDINIGICFDDEHSRSVKVEDKEEEEEAAILGFDLDDASGGRETLVLNCDFEPTTTMMMMIKEEEEEEKKVVNDEEEEDMMMMMMVGKSSSSIISLRLNYEDVINSWGDQGSPWTNGTRPELNSCLPDNFMESWWLGNKSTMNPNYSYGRSEVDGGREERVRRYREKRRRRLFSKKIRYQVRKLNAEKRPRMKGRFVKREIQIN